MADRTGIAWTDATWNPVTGCSHVSPGCENCYAEAVSTRFGRTSKPWGAQHAGENVVLHTERLTEPLHWRKPRKIFVCSMADLFHDQVPNDFIAAVFGIMAACPQHTFQVLTKRPKRMRQWFEWLDGCTKTVKVVFTDDTERGRRFHVLRAATYRFGVSYVDQAPEETLWPLPNLWAGTSAEDQPRLDERIGELLQTPAAVRWLSLEPLLGRVDVGYLAWVSLPRTVSSGFPFFLSEPPFDRLVARPGIHPAYLNPHGAVSAVIGEKRLGIKPDEMDWCRKIDWVVVGGESGGPPERALVERCNYRFWHGIQSTPGPRWIPKSEALYWVRSIHDQCVAAKVPFFFKQWGGPTYKSGGRLLDGREWSQFPDGKGGIVEGVAT